MKVQFLKQHLTNKVGDVIEVTQERGNYLILAKAAKMYVKKDKPKSDKK